MCLVADMVGESLSSYYKCFKITDSEFGRIGMEILSAMTFLHEKDIAHNNLTAENVLKL
jgi:serine/threonine protein kinase